MQAVFYHLPLVGQVRLPTLLLLYYRQERVKRQIQTRLPPALLLRRPAHARGRRVRRARLGRHLDVPLHIQRLLPV